MPVADTRSLVAVQQWLSEVIRHPDGPSAAAASPRASELIPGAGADLGRVIADTGGLAPEQRLELYRRGYHLRLLSCMREVFPALRHALGPDLFDDLALGYLAQCPSRSFTLARLGAGFSGWLEETRPDRHGEREWWPDFLVDLAALEQAFLEVYDGPGLEGEGAMPSGSFPLPERVPPWGARAMALPSPALRLVTSRFPVDRYLREARSGLNPPLPLPEATTVAMCRRDYKVVLTPLDRREWSALRRLVGGEELAVVANASGADLHQAWAWLRSWAELGLVRSVVSPPIGGRSP